MFAFSRLLSAVPITPGGVGVIDLGYIGGLAAAAPDGEKAAVVGAVLDVPRADLRRTDPARAPSPT